MTIQEDILDELMTESIKKIIGEPGQDDTNNIDSELDKQAAEIKKDANMDFQFSIRAI